jgi:hypothetical protein
MEYKGIFKLLTSTSVNFLLSVYGEEARRRGYQAGACLRGIFATNPSGQKRTNVLYYHHVELRG